MKQKLWREPKTWRIAICVVTALLLLVELLPGSAVSAVREETGIVYVRGSFLMPKAFASAYFWLALLTTVSALYLSLLDLVHKTGSRKWLMLLRAVLLVALNLFQHTTHPVPFGKTTFGYCLIPILAVVFLACSVLAIVMRPEQEGGNRNESAKGHRGAAQRPAI